ncbi:MAG: translocation/assembly module TamB domain-containing protein, partial [Thermoanaerobaculia bacterium]
RRWLLRPAMWGIALVAILVLCAGIFLRSEFLSELIRERLVIEAARFLDREVVIETLEFRLLPLWVEVGGVRIGGPDPEDPPILEIERVFVEAELFGWRQPAVALRQVKVEAPLVRLDVFEDGGRNWPRFQKQPRSEPRREPLQITIDYLSVEDGVFELDHKKIPLALTARAVQGFMSGGPGLHIQGRVAAQEVEVTLPKARPFLGAVGLKVAVDPGRVEIAGGRVSGPDITAAIQGHAGWKDDREITVRVQAAGSTSFFRQIGYLEDQIEGPFTFEGGVVWRPKNVDIQGELRSPSLRVLDRRVDDVVLVATGNEKSYRLGLKNAIYGGGRLAGGVTFDVGADPRTMEVDLSLEGVDLQRLLDDQQIPVDGFAGRVYGVFDYRFAMGRAQHGVGWADLKIEPPEGESAGLAVTGTVPVSIEGGVIRTVAGELVAGAQRVVTEGFYELDSHSGRFDYEITTGDAPELLGLLPGQADAETPPLWYPTAGHGEAEGTLYLEPGNLHTELGFSLFEVSAPGVTADEVRASMAIAADRVERLRVELSRPGAGLIVSGSFPLGEAEADEPVAPFYLTVDAVGWPMSEARAWLPFELPLDGRVTGALELSGDLERPVGELRAELEPAIVGGVEYGILRLDLDFDPEKTSFRRAVLAMDAGDIVVEGAIDNETETLNFVLDSMPLELASPPFSDLVTTPLTGRLEAQGVVGGTLVCPTLEADLVWHDLAVADHRLGDQGEARARVEWNGTELSLDGDLFGLLLINGGGRLDREAVDLLFQVEGTDLQAIAQLTREEELPEFAGRFSGELELVGEPSSEEPWSKVVRLDHFEAEYADHRVENVEPVVVRLEDDGVRIDSFFVAEPDGATELFLAGLVRSDEVRTLDLRLQGSLESRWFDLVLPDLGLREGQFDVLATVGGTVERPILNGQGAISDARVVSTLLPHSLGQVGGLILFYPDQIVVDNLAGRMAGGEVKASGALGLPDPEAAGEFEYRLQVVGKDLSVRFPEGWLSRGDAELVLISTPDGRQVRGNIDLERAMYLQDVPMGMGQMLQGLFARQRVQVETANEMLATTSLQISINGPEALRVSNNLADLTGDLDLVVRGTAARPVIFGRVDIDRESTLEYGGNEYSIEHGRLNFANPFRIEPVIDLAATTRVREYNVTLNLSGSFDRLNASFSSDPPLGDLEVLALLTTGEESLARVGTTEQDAAGVRASSLLYGQASSMVSERARKLFGLDQFRIEPLTSSTGEPSSTRFTIGERLSRDVFATYSFDPSTTEQWILQLEWSVNRGMTLVLTQNGDDSYSVDVRWQKSF